MPSRSFADVIAGWDGESVVIRHDAEFDAWFFVALHNTTTGNAVGGCRMKTYESPADGLVDAIRLAEGMTYKWAAVNIPLGGGKSVLAVPGPVNGEKRERLFQHFGRLIQSLNGAFSTGVDLGTNPEDMVTLGRTTDYVMGLSEDRTSSADPGPYTALGVFQGIQAAVENRFGPKGLAGRSVLVQGIGDVGLPLARYLNKAGSQLLISDIDEDLAKGVAAEFDADVVDTESVFETPCDVFAPCAIGGILNAETIGKLRCQIVAGSANAQLGVPEDAHRLHKAGILYAPDYIVNAGGAIAFAMMSRGQRDAVELRTAVAKIGDSIRDILEEADEADQSPAVAARSRADRVLNAARV